MGSAARNWLLRNRAFLLYVPVAVGMAAWAMRRGLHPISAIGLWVAGLALWTLLEWVLHRAMHVRTGIQAISRLQDSAHLRHHREPDDLEHSVIRISASLPLTLLLLGIARLTLGHWERAMMLMCGLLTGYLFYEFVHLTSHGNRRVPGLRLLHRYHRRHHFEQLNRGFGVTSPIWDLIFGTLPIARVEERR